MPGRTHFLLFSSFFLFSRTFSLYKAKFEIFSSGLLGSEEKSFWTSFCWKFRYNFVYIYQNVFTIVPSLTNLQRYQLKLRKYCFWIVFSMIRWKKITFCFHRCCWRYGLSSSRWHCERNRWNCDTPGPGCWSSASAAGWRIRVARKSCRRTATWSRRDSGIGSPAAVAAVAAGLASSSKIFKRCE